MGWQERFQVDEDEVTLDSGMIGHRGPRLCLNLKEIEALGSEGVLRLVEWFCRYGPSIATLKDAEECKFHPQYVDDRTLRHIIEDPLLPEEWKEEARRVRDQRERPLPAPSPPTKQSQKRPGFVYVLRAEDGSGLHKIGATRSFSRRVPEIGVKLPFETALLVTIPSADPWTLESALHEQFAAQRVRGEWFRLTEAQVGEILGTAL